MSKLYLECTSGISGDMFVASLLDLGADQKKLLQVLETIPISGYQVQISRVKKSGLDVCDFNVVLDEEHENHDHDMSYLYGIHDEKHCHDDSEHHHGDSGHDHHHYDSGHGHHHHGDTGHTHRGLREVMELVDQTQMSDRARFLAARVFHILGEAEAKAHGTTLEQVHFHEVGAIDSIVDIIAAAVCLDDLDITETVIPCLCEGRGTVRCQHGILPVPVPAVVNIIQSSGLPLHLTDRSGELITPTGAAIAAAICTTNQLPDRYRIRRTGIGAGKRAYEIPSLLRAMLIEEVQQESEDLICKLETNIDDCSGELLGHVMDRLFDAGARDVVYKPVYMKKNRPAYELEVLCMPEDTKAMEEILFSETTTIGIRRCMMERTVLSRELRHIETSAGKATVKICSFGDRKMIYPEYDSAVELSQKNGMPLKEIYHLIERECCDI